MLLAYISGPLTTFGDYQENLKAAEAAFTALKDVPGLAVFCPHLMDSHKFLRKLSQEEWMAYNLKMLSLCDIVLALPGCENSEGCQKELAHASYAGVRIFTSIERLKEYVASNLL